MGRIKKRRLRWEPSSNLDVIKYRIYWAKDGGVDYDSDSWEAGNVTQLILPDDIPCFPLTAGEVELGISAVNQAGNESELTKTRVYFDFTVPEPPKGLEIEDF